jgi:hypothetical protein
MAELKQKEMTAAQQQIEKAKKELTLIEETRAIEAAKLTFDIAGIADPTPTSDGMSCTLSLATGDYWGALLSVVSMVPYAGDAAAKPIKVMQATSKLQALNARLSKATRDLNKAREVLTPQGQVAASKKAATSVRAKIAKEGNGNCQYGTTVPARGA